MRQWLRSCFGFLALALVRYSCTHRDVHSQQNALQVAEMTMDMDVFLGTLRGGAWDSHAHECTTYFLNLYSCITLTKMNVLYRLVFMFSMTLIKCLCIFPKTHHRWLVEQSCQQCVSPLIRLSCWPRWGLWVTALTTCKNCRKMSGNKFNLCGLQLSLCMRRDAALAREQLMQHWDQSKQGEEEQSSRAAALKSL